MTDEKTYPKNKEEWSIAIHKGLSITQIEGEQLFQSENFPVEDLVKLIQKEYSKSFGPEFVPALVRNIKGLISWVYGDGSEPFWPGSDS